MPMSPAKPATCVTAFAKDVLDHLREIAKAVRITNYKWITQSSVWMNALIISMRMKLPENVSLVMNNVMAAMALPMKIVLNVKILKSFKTIIIRYLCSA